MKNPNSLTWSLYNTSYKYPFSFIKNAIKDTLIVIKRIIFVIQNGYYPQANFETYEYLIYMWKDLLTWYKTERAGTAVVIDLPEDGNMNDEWYAENDRVYDEKLDAMLAELDIMAKDPFDYDDYREGEQIREEAKDRFFEMFKEIFYTLWD